MGTPLKDWDIKINEGVIVTWAQRSIYYGSNTRDKLIKDDPKSAEIIRPILRGKDIKQNGYNFKEQYVILCIFGSRTSRMIT